MSDNEKFETIQIYSPNTNSIANKLIPLPPDHSDITCCEETRTWQGFQKEYEKITAGFSNDQTNTLELHEYYSKEHGRVVEIWDDNT